ncbi:MAG: hypothetical protein M1G31_01085 [Pseudanabaena sp. Salubria-1]|jgi:hypothetical protein|nr:hypothetical protein [Pseudanabaena sp. Salubria-1]
MLAKEQARGTANELFRLHLKNYPLWDNSSRINLAQKFLEKRRNRLAQMTVSEMQDAEVAFDRFKVSIDSDRAVDAKLYL